MAIEIRDKQCIFFDCIHAEFTTIRSNVAHEHFKSAAISVIRGHNVCIFSIPRCRSGRPRGAPP